MAVQSSPDGARAVLAEVWACSAEEGAQSSREPPAPQRLDFEPCSASPPRHLGSSPRRGGLSTPCSSRQGPPGGPPGGFPGGASQAGSSSYCSSPFSRHCHEPCPVDHTDAEEPGVLHVAGRSSLHVEGPEFEGTKREGGCALPQRGLCGETDAHRPELRAGRTAVEEEAASGQAGSRLLCAVM